MAGQASRLLRIAPPRNPRVNSGFTLAEGATHVDLWKYVNRVAFTLAEVLITLGVIGVVSAMTIPTLIGNHREKVTVSRLTHTYSLLSQAIERMIQDEGDQTIQYWGSNAQERTAKFEELLPKYVQIAKTCKKGTQGCLSRTHYTPGVVGAPSNAWVTGNTPLANSYLLKNGVSIKITPSGTCQQDTTLQKKGCSENDTSCSHSAPILNYGTYQHDCIRLFVDINGPSGPNKTDIDAFEFAVVQNGIVPLGSSKESVWTQTFGNCQKFAQYYNGRCAAWVIYNKNMDYLRCPDKLGWNKASSCKE